MIYYKLFNCLLYKDVALRRHVCIHAVSIQRCSPTVSFSVGGTFRVRNVVSSDQGRS